MRAEDAQKIAIAAHSKIITQGIEEFVAQHIRKLAKKGKTEAIFDFKNIAFSLKIAITDIVFILMKKIIFI